MASITSLAVAGALALTSSACFVTTTESTATATGPRLENQQWFTGLGALRLGNTTAGRECGAAGLAWSESGAGLGDLFIDGALAVAAGLAGSAVCPLAEHPTAGDAMTYATCTSLFGALGPALLARKTVHYRCARR